MTNKKYFEPSTEVFFLKGERLMDSAEASPGKNDVPTDGPQDPNNPAFSPAKGIV